MDNQLQLNVINYKKDAYIVIEGMSTHSHIDKVRAFSVEELTKQTKYMRKMDKIEKNKQQSHARNQ